MFTKQIKNRKIKDAFEELLGKENSRKILSLIQHEYDKGVRGDKLKAYAQGIIEDLPGIASDKSKLAVIIVAFIVV